MGRTLKFNWFKSCKTGMRSLCNGFTMEVRLSVAHTKLKIHIFLCLNMAVAGFFTPHSDERRWNCSSWWRSPTALCSLFRCLPVFLYDVDDYKLCGVVICLTCLWKCVEARCFLGFHLTVSSGVIRHPEPAWMYIYLRKIWDLKEGDEWYVSKKELMDLFSDRRCH